MENLLQTQGPGREDDLLSSVPSFAHSSIEPPEVESTAGFRFDDLAMEGMPSEENYARQDLDTSIGPLFCEPLVEPVWDIMELGLDEPLPVPEVLDEL